MDGFKDDSGNNAPLLKHFQFVAEPHKNIVIAPREVARFLLEGQVGAACLHDIASLLPLQSRDTYSTRSKPMSLGMQYQLLAHFVLRDQLHLSPEDTGRLGRFTWQGDERSLQQNAVFAKYQPIGA